MLLSPKDSKRLAEKYNLGLLLLFGSHAQGKANQWSDVDLAFWRYQDFSAEEEKKLYDDVFALLHKNKIDLINIKKTYDALLRYQIFMNGIVLYEKKTDRFNTMKWQAYFDYEDFKHYYLKKEKAVERKLKKLMQNQ